ncbi:MAG TPA: tellurite resistance TerB family protein [Kiloniellaceae bacterium]|nr:tellurite resistance TerB family protein [Kiloniellaceae bacterium]
MKDHQAALIHTMVLVSAADREMTDAEMLAIGDMVKHLPVFEGCTSENLIAAAEDCAALLNAAEGFDHVIDKIRAALPQKLSETAYALACEIAAADGRASQEELKLLAVLRVRLAVGRLPAAAIERGAAARHMTL